MMDTKIETYGDKPILTIHRTKDIKYHTTEEDSLTLEFLITNVIDEDFGNAFVSATKKLSQLILSVDKKYFDFSSLQFINENFLIMNVRQVSNSIRFTLYRISRLSHSMIKNNWKIFNSLCLKNSSNSTLLLSYSLNENIRISKSNSKFMEKITFESQQLHNHIDTIQNLLKR